MSDVTIRHEAQRSTAVVHRVVPMSELTLERSVRLTPADRM
jgi:hypothetical protein